MERQITSDSGNVVIFQDARGYGYQHRCYPEAPARFPTVREAALAAGLSKEEAARIEYGDWSEPRDATDEAAD